MPRQRTSRTPATSSDPLWGDMPRDVDLASWRSSGKRLVLQSRTVFVRSEGSGPALLFLHGFPTTSYDFHAIVEQLARSHRCVAFDFAGFGESDPPDHYDYDAQTDLALAVAEHEKVERAVVVAHDYGVSVAQELLARAPSSLHIDGVVFLNGGLVSSLHRALPVQRLLASPLGRLLGPVAVRKSTFVRAMRRILVRAERFDFEEHWRAISARGSHRRAHFLLRYIAERRRRSTRWTEVLRSSSTPMAFAWGMRDPVSGAHVLEWVRAARPDADMLALDVGHYPQVEAPEEVARFVERFAATHGR